MKIKKKLLLVLLLAGAEAFCVTWGLVVFGSWLKANAAETIREQILAENVETARQMTRLIREMRIDDPRGDIEAWNRLQAVIRDIRLPNDGYICLTDDATGGVLCHPAMQQHPLLSQVAMAKKPAMGKPMQKPPMQKPPMQPKQMPPKPMPPKAMPPKAMPPKPPMTPGEPPAAAAETDEPALLAASNETHQILAEYPNGLEIIGAATLSEIHARVQVHQSDEGVQQAVNRFIEPVLPIGVAVGVGLVALSTVFVVSIVRRYENHLADLNENLEELVERRTRALTKTRNAVIFGLAKLAESRDTDTGEHLERIRKYVTILAKQLRREGIDVDEAFIQNIGLASSLHDIGKVGVPDAVLLKPGKLDPDERKIIETHARLGGDCLRAIGERLGEDDFLQMATEIAYGHHERWDGDGYPFGVAGESIPLSARITAVADVYDALRSTRPYKRGMSHERARDILLEGACKHFDPLVIEAFLAAEREFEQASPYGAVEQKAEHVENQLVAAV